MKYPWQRERVRVSPYIYNLSSPFLFPVFDPSPSVPWTFPFPIIAHLHLQNLEMAASAPPFSSPARRLLRALSIPILPGPAVLESDSPIIELDELLPPPPPHSQRAAAIQDGQEQYLTQRRQGRAATETGSSRTATRSQSPCKLPWPTQLIRGDEDRPHRPSIDSIFSDVSALSILSESEPRTRSRRVTRKTQRETEAESVWNDFWS